MDDNNNNDNISLALPNGVSAKYIALRCHGMSNSFACGFECNAQSKRYQ